MISYLVKKLGYALVILFSVATVVFFLFSASFPSAEEVLVSDRTDDQTLTAIKKELGLDRSLGMQYLLYLNDLAPISYYPNEHSQVKGLNLGKHWMLKGPYLRRSFQSGKSTSAILRSSFKNTLVLALLAIILGSFLGIIAGVFSAIAKGTWIDRLILFLTTIGISVPSFFSAIIIGWLFGYLYSSYTGLSLTGSLYDVDPFKGRIIVWKNAILPALALGLRPMSIITQLSRNSMIDALSKDYIRTARSKGLSKRVIYFKHALRNALNPVITSISGWFASLLAGAFFIEYIFNWNGLGKVTIDALEMSDLPVIMGSILFVATIFVFVNILVDIIYTVLDPRIKLEE
jgi:peptide/nickel transport system permease protein